MTYDASSRKDIRKAEKSADIAAANRVAYIKHIMSEPFGRAWMHDLLADAGMFHEQFVPNNQHATAFNLGKVAMIKPIWVLVFNFCPNEYILMMQEQAIKEAANDRHNGDEYASAGSARSEPDLGRDDNRSVNGEADESDDPGRYVTAEGFVDFRHKAH